MCFEKKETLVAGFTYPKKTGAHYIIYIQHVYIYIERLTKYGYIDIISTHIQYVIQYARATAKGPALENMQETDRAVSKTVQT